MSLFVIKRRQSRRASPEDRSQSLCRIPVTATRKQKIIPKIAISCLHAKNLRASNPATPRKRAVEKRSFSTARVLICRLVSVGFTGACGQTVDIKHCTFRRRPSTVRMLFLAMRGISYRRKCIECIWRRREKCIMIAENASARPHACST